MKLFCSALVMLAVAACTPARIYVSTDGNDNSEGRKGSPLATAATALSRASELSLAHPGSTVEIVFKEGGYSIKEGLAIDGSMFAGPLTMHAADGAEVVFSGEKKTGPWQKVSDAHALETLPCPENVLQTDLTAAGITDTGTPAGDNNRFDFYFNGKRQTLSRWPDEGFAYAGKALGKTPYPSYLGDTYVEAVLEYTDARMDNWAQEDAPYMHGYWGYDWFDMYNPVSFDTASKSMTIEGETSRYGYRKGCRFRGVNLLCELDSPGEYWVDRKNGLLFWYAPEDFNGEGTSVSLFPEKAMLTLTECSDVNIKGIEMCGGRGGAVIVNGGRNIVFEDCSFFRFAQDVATVNGGTGHKFLHCQMSELGCAGIILKGGDRTTLEPAGFEVSDCTIETLSLYRKTYQPCIRFGGCGLTITHNLFHDCPSSALRLDGNEILVEYNRFEDLVLESDDQGGIDIFNNYNFRGIRILHNYFHNIGDPKDNIAGGVRFDDRISGLLVEGNVFNHCGSSGFGGVQIHGGQDNLITGNVFYDCTYALSQSPWDVERWFKMSENDLSVLGLTPEMDSLTPMGKLYLERYPDIAHVFDAELVNRNYLKGNLVVKTPELITRGRNIVSEDNTFLPEDSGHSLEYWISDKVLAEHGIAPVGFESMGPRK